MVNNMFGLEAILMEPIIKTIALAISSSLTYSTIKKDKFMENETRKDAYNIICTNEGITYTVLQNMLGAANGPLWHHLYQMERRKYIKSVKDGLFRRFYPADANISGLGRMEELILYAACARIDAGEKAPSQKEIANTINTTPQTVNHHVKKLVEGGNVYLVPDGHNRRVMPTDHAFRSYQQRQCASA